MRALAKNKVSRSVCKKTLSLSKSCYCFSFFLDFIVGRDLQEVIAERWENFSISGWLAADLMLDEFLHFLHCFHDHPKRSLLENATWVWFTFNGLLDTHLLLWPIEKWMVDTEVEKGLQKVSFVSELNETFKNSFSNSVVTVNHYCTYMYNGLRYWLCIYITNPHLSVRMSVSHAYSRNCLTYGHEILCA